MIMSSTKSDQQPRKKWTRAKTPRVRTGCITCKVRHLKCDEGKPTCQRCLRDKQRCDGYEEIKVPKRKKKEKKSLKVIEYGILRPALSLVKHAYPSDAALFHHAREYTIKDFDAASCSSFWNRFVLPLAHNAEAVKYALCALGGAHRRFVTGYPGHSTCSSTPAEFEMVSIQKYNQAIEHMRPLLLDETESSLQTVLVCCVIFICIESLHGRYEDAIRHVRSGCQLLNSLRGRVKLQQGHLAEMHYRSLGSIDYNLFGMVSEMLLRLGQNVALYEGHDTFYDLTAPARVMNMGSSKQPFADLIEADTLLDYVGDIYDSFVIESEIGDSPDGSPPSHSLDYRPSVDTTRMAMNAARFAFSIWDSRYEATKASERYQNPSHDEQYALAFFDLHQATWMALTKLDTGEEDLAKEDCQLMLQRASALIDLEKKGPVFVFNGYLIPTLTMVCGGCVDIDTQRQAISMLRRLHRREGIWDSEEIADIFETMIAVEEQNGVDRDSLPWGIPALAAELSALSISGSNSPCSKIQANKIQHEAPMYAFEAQSVHDVAISGEGRLSCMV